MEILKIHNNPERAEWAALTERFTREEEEITRQKSPAASRGAIPGRSKFRPTCAPQPPRSSPPR